MLRWLIARSRLRSGHHHHQSELLASWLQPTRKRAAVVDARKAVELAPDSADVTSLVGFILTPSGHPEEALVQSEKAIALSPSYPAVYLGILGDAYRQAGRTGQAIAAFKDLSRAKPPDSA
jgi:Flp pilus assembly protein TadD